MSSDNNMELSRRKILGSIGAVGAAGAGAGLGTSALFSDTESFVNNSITAGELDLKVDWEEHYSFPQIYDDFEDPTSGLDVTRTEPDNIENYVGLPDPTDPVVWVHNDDFEEYFENTIIEGFPDISDSGQIEVNFNDLGQPCTVLADVPQDFNTYADDGLGRTRNADTYDSENEQSLPLINLWDVKPGDYGEITFSTHLCFNDGYLWAQMPGGLEESENGINDPEEEAGDDTPEEGELAENIQTTLWYDDDCSNTIDDDADPLVAIALIDASDSIGTEDMQTIADASDEFVEQLNNEAATEVAAGVMTFSGDDPAPGEDDPSIVLRNGVEKLEPGSAYLDGSGSGRFEPGETLLPEQGSGTTPLAPALDLAREYLNDQAQTLINTSGNGFGPNTRKTILVLSDGLPTTPGTERYELVDTAGTQVTAESGTGVTNGDEGEFLSDVFDGAVDGSTSTTGNRDEAALVARDIDVGGKSDTGPGGTSDGPDISGANDITLRTVGLGTDDESDLNDFLARVATDDFFYNASLVGSDLVDVVDDIVTDLNVTGSPEEVIFRGTLRQLADELNPDINGPLPLDGMRLNDDFDELNDPDDDPARDPFDASATHCFGLAWWVPTEVGNEIQSDSVGFDFGFVTEQARNNDDPGQTFGFGNS